MNAPPIPPPPGEPRRMRILGVHHVTLICGDVAATTAFYRDVLGLTVVREADNDDDPGTRHVWFGDPAGTPGTLISFLEYPQMGPGTVGRGSTHHLALAIADREELEAWREHLQQRGVPVTEVLERGGLASLYLRDPDGHILELTAPGP